ncbi:MAG: glycosyltransferase family 39 protein, partial [Bacteroidota bacterium]
MPKKTVLYYLLAILAVALITRTYRLTELGPWQDERLSIMAAHGQILTEPAELVQPFTSKDYEALDTYGNMRDAVIAVEGGNTIAYQTLLRAWTHTIGTRDAAIRLLNILIGLATVWLLFAFTTRLTGDPWLGLLAAVIAAIHPLLIQYSIELRSYNTAGFFTLLATHLFVMLFVKPDEERTSNRTYLLTVGYFGAMLLCLLTHYLTLFVLAAHFGYMLFFSRKMKEWLLYGAAGIGVAIGFYMWMIPLKGNEGLEHIAARNEKWLNLVEIEYAYE